MLLIDSMNQSPKHTSENNVPTEVNDRRVEYLRKLNRQKQVGERATRSQVRVGQRNSWEGAYYRRQSEEPHRTSTGGYEFPDDL